MTAHITVVEALGHCNPSVQYAMVDRQLISIFGVTETYVYANLLFFDTYNMTPKHSKRYPGYLEFDVDHFCALCNMPRKDVIAALNKLHSTEILDFDEDNEVYCLYQFKVQDNTLYLFSGTDSTWVAQQRD